MQWSIPGFRSKALRMTLFCRPGRATPFEVDRILLSLSLLGFSNHEQMLTCAECLPLWFEVTTELLSFSFCSPMGPSPVLPVHVKVKAGGLSFPAPV